jgi:branched-chain amino acid transport system substrate-binding protein
MRRATVALVLCAALTYLAGCGASKDLPNDTVPGTTLTIYASVPLNGASRISGVAVLSGAQLALAQIHGRIGHYRIELKPLDDATVQRRQWDPGQTTLNAREAVQDPTTIGYLGDLDSGASAVSIPILNRAGIPQISPGSTAVGLTSDGPGAAPGEPEKYYPTGERTFARVVPNDAVQSAAMLKLQLSFGCRKTVALDDDEVDGEDMATTFAAVAKASPLTVVGLESFEPTATDYSSLAAGVAASGADCVLISGLADSNVALLSTQLAAAMPHAMIFGSAGLAEGTYTGPIDGGVPVRLDSRMLITAPADPLQATPSRLVSELDAPRNSYGIFGYEAMSLMLSSIDRATSHGRNPARRAAVVAAIFATRNRHSAIGTYSIDRDGDTTLDIYGVYRVVGGRLQLWQAVAA